MYLKMNEEEKNAYKKYLDSLYEKANIKMFERPDFKKNLHTYLQSAQTLVTNVSIQTASTAITPELEYVLRLRYNMFFHFIISKHPFSKSKCYERGMALTQSYAMAFMDELEKLKDVKLKKFFLEKHRKTTQPPPSTQRQQEQRKMNNVVNPSSRTLSPPTASLPSQNPQYSPSTNINTNTPSADSSSSSSSITKFVPHLGITVKEEPLVCGLRKVYVNQRLVDDFLKHSFQHIQAGIEFCGILCGSVHLNAFYVTTCILPEQEGTEDSVNCLNEMDMFNYQIKNKLLTVGWIHTHPTQEAFLSSIDLSTHFGYQQMLPESIAIVCSPRTKRGKPLGCFRIINQEMEVLERKMKENPDIGRKFVKIADRVMFENCGHVVMNYNSNLKFQVGDLRKNKGIKYSKNFNPGKLGTKNKNQQQSIPPGHLRSPAGRPSQKRSGQYHMPLRSSGKPSSSSTMQQAMLLQQQQQRQNQMNPGYSNNNNRQQQHFNNYGYGMNQNQGTTQQRQNVNRNNNNLQGRQVGYQPRSNTGYKQSSLYPNMK